MLLAKKLMKTESGSITASLTLVALLFVVMVWVLRISQDVVSADVVLKNSTAIAVRAAASQYDEETGLIYLQKAQQAFERLLRKNLKLTGNLEARKGSLFSGQLAYKLIVYNGWETEKEPAGIIYEYRDNRLFETEIEGDGFPKTLYLGPEVRVKMPSPGAVATVEINSSAVYDKEVAYARWAAAKVVVKPGEEKDDYSQWAVVFLGSEK